jgi:hypothetical protein
VLPGLAREPAAGPEVRPRSFQTSQAEGPRVKTRDQIAAERYLENVGHPPPEAPEDQAWQWSYRGTPEERELLLDLIQAEAEAEVSAEQTSLC